jgi:hypothetical protein
VFLVSPIHPSKPFDDPAEIAIAMVLFRKRIHRPACTTPFIKLAFQSALFASQPICVRSLGLFSFSSRKSESFPSGLTLFSIRKLSQPANSTPFFSPFHQPIRESSCEEQSELVFTGPSVSSPFVTCKKTSNKVRFYWSVCRFLYEHFFCMKVLT